MTKHITIELTETEEAHLVAMAERDGLSLEGALSKMIQQKMEHDSWLADIVEEGLEDLRAGRTLSHEEVVEQGRQLREELLRKKAG